MALKDIKKSIDEKILSSEVVRDEYGNVVIDMTVTDDSNFLSPFSMKTQPVISTDVADFLETSTCSYVPDESFSLKIHSDCIDENEQKVYPKAIAEYYTQRYVACEKELDRNAIISMILALFGIFALAVMITLENLLIGSVWTEVIDIIAWVFLWEAIYIAFLTNRGLKLKRKRYLSLINMKVEFLSLK